MSPESNRCDRYTTAALLHGTPCFAIMLYVMCCSLPIALAIQNYTYNMEISQWRRVTLTVRQSACLNARLTSHFLK